MKTFNVYLTGVGGQGIGLISEAVLRAADHAGHRVKSVDTHGLAQRGGIVVSQIRMGDSVYSPLIPEGQADLAISLESMDLENHMIREKMHTDTLTGLHNRRAFREEISQRISRVPRPAAPAALPRKPSAAVWPR